MRHDSPSLRLSTDETRSIHAASHGQCIHHTSLVSKSTKFLDGAQEYSHPIPTVLGIQPGHSRVTYTATTGYCQSAAARARDG
eukprot:scaffold301_cov243-Pinguiococcus_pyrenoidosus.AAC.32